MQTKVTLAQLTQLYESHTPLNSLIVRYALFCLLLILMPPKSALGAYSFLTACLSQSVPTNRHLLATSENCRVLFRATVNLTSGLNSRKIVSRAYLQYYLR